MLLFSAKTHSMLTPSQREIYRLCLLETPLQVLYWCKLDEYDKKWCSKLCSIKFDIGQVFLAKTRRNARYSTHHLVPASLRPCRAFKCESWRNAKRNLG